MYLGLKDFYKAKGTIGENGAITYATPAKVPGLIGIDLSVEYAEGELYADDSLDYYAREFVKATLKINTSDITDDVMAEFLGYEKDADSVIYAGKESTEALPFFAVAFAAKKKGGKYRYVWIPYVTFKAPDDSLKTKDKTINIVTPTIEGLVRKGADGRWMCSKVLEPTDALAQSWFSTVRAFNPTT